MVRRGWYSNRSAGGVTRPGWIAGSPAGVLDAARVRVAARRMRRQVRLRMAVDPQMWGLSAGPAAYAGTWAGPGPVLRIIAAGTPRPLDAEAIKPWM